MKSKLLTAALFVLCASSAVFADDQAKEKSEMMKAWKEFATPGAAHQVLAKMAGQWKYTSKWWETADSKPQESKGTSSIKMVLGGRFLQHATHGKSMGMPFEGVGITGYNNMTKKYETLWLDNMSTGMMHGTGSYDEATKTLKDSGEFTCPTKKSPQSYHAEWKVIDRNHMMYTMWGPDKKDNEIKMMELSFTRVR